MESEGAAACNKLVGKSIVFGISTKAGTTSWAFEGVCDQQTFLPIKLMKAVNEETECFLEDGHFRITKIVKGRGPSCKFKKGIVVDEEGNSIQVLEAVDDFETNAFYVFGSALLIKPVHQEAKKTSSKKKKKVSSRKKKKKGLASASEGESELEVSGDSASGSDHDGCA